MSNGPEYEVVEDIQGNHRLALVRFGGTRWNNDAAWVKVEEKLALRIVAPSMSTAAQEFFQSEVKELIKAHDLRGRKGDVFVLFNPPTGGTFSVTDLLPWEFVEHRPRA